MFLFDNRTKIEHCSAFGVLSACSARLAHALRRPRAIGAQVAGRHALILLAQLLNFNFWAARARPLPPPQASELLFSSDVGEALPPSAPRPPTLTPQPRAEVSNWGQKQGGLGLCSPACLLRCATQKNCDRSSQASERSGDVRTAAIFSIRRFGQSGAGAVISALRSSRGVRACAAPSGASRGAFLPTCFLFLCQVFILRLCLVRSA
jgi:hypothetical protein